MDHLTALSTFRAVADTGSFSSAARQLTVATSVVSKRVRDLEQDLGVTLFNRTTRSVVLTDAGERLLGHAGDVLAAMARLRATVSEQTARVSGRIRVSAPTSFSWT